MTAQDMIDLLQVYDACVELGNYCGKINSAVVESDSIIARLTKVANVIDRHSAVYNEKLDDTEGTNVFHFFALECKEVSYSDRAKILLGEMPENEIFEMMDKYPQRITFFM